MASKKKIEVVFDANVDKFGRNVDRASRDLTKFSGKANVVSTNIKRSFSGIGAALAGAISVGALAVFTKNALDAADAIEKVSSVSGLSAKRVQEFRFAVDQTGGTLQQADAAILKFGKRVGLAKEGFGAAAKAYKRLGIDLSQTTDQVFRSAINEIGKLTLETERGALATELFGEDAIKLGLTFKDGLSGFNAFAEKAHDLGLILSDDLVDGAAEANDQLSIMKQVLDIQFTRVFVELAPTITRVGEAFAATAIKASAFLDAMNDIGDQGKKTLKNTIKILQSEFAGLQSELDDTIQKQAGTKQGTAAEIVLTAIGLGGLRDPSEIKKEMDKVEKEFNQAIERLASLNRLSEQTKAPLATNPPGDKPGKSGKPKKLPTLRLPKKEKVKAFKDPLDDFTQSLFRYKEELDLINPKMERLGKLFADGAIPLEVYQEGLKRLGQQTETVFNEMPEQIEEANDAAQELGFTFSSAFEDAIVGGNNLSDVLKGLEQDIARIVTRKLVTEPLGNALSGIASNSFSEVSGLFSGLFGGGGASVSSIPLRASGGPVSGGSPYIVGEQGPELIVPRQSGNVIPNGSYGGVTVNINSMPADANPEAYRLSARQGALEGSRLLSQSRSIT